MPKLVPQKWSGMGPYQMQTLTIGVLLGFSIDNKVGGGGGNLWQGTIHSITYLHIPRGVVHDV